MEEPKIEAIEEIVIAVMGGFTQEIYSGPIKKVGCTLLTVKKI